MGGRAITSEGPTLRHVLFKDNLVSFVTVGPLSYGDTLYSSCVQFLCTVLKFLFCIFTSWHYFHEIVPSNNFICSVSRKVQ